MRHLEPPRGICLRGAAATDSSPVDERRGRGKLSQLTSKTTVVLGALGPRQESPHLTIPNHAVPILSFWPEDVSRADVNDERSRPRLSVVVDAVRAADDPVPVEAIQGKIRRGRVRFQSSPPLVSARPPPRAESLFRVAPADDVAEILGLAAY